MGALVLANDTYFLMTPLDAGALTPVLTPYSARGLSQSLEPIVRNDWLQRDVNGTLRNISDPRWRKYISEVSCNDAETPCLDGAWIGAAVLVECACELSYPTGGTPQRPAVPNSERTEGANTFYRPHLAMMVAAIKSNFREYGGVYAWQFRLEEI